MAWGSDKKIKVVELAKLMTMPRQPWFLYLDKVRASLDSSLFILNLNHLQVAHLKE